MAIRKNQANLTPAERAAFVAAVRALKASGQYDMFVAQHRAAFMASPNDPAHAGPGFFPWHREFLRRFERALQLIDPGVSLPYWDWTADSSPTSSLWAPDLMGGNGSGPGGQVADGPFAYASGQWTLTVLDPGDARPFLSRAFGSHGSLPTAAAVETARRVTPYDSSPWNSSSVPSRSFRNTLEGWIHGPGHMWVGGSMMQMSSPNDPVFWLHHCNIDRLWAEWQRAHPTEVYIPPSGTLGVVAGHALDDPMPPWQGEPTPPTPRSVLDHALLGYTYDTEPTLPQGPRTAQGDDMRPGEVLKPTQSITSANGQFAFVYQSDGNLVLYRTADWTPIWASRTAGKPAGVCLMQIDGNLVLYSPAGLPLWSSGTWQNPMSVLLLQDDGNVVIYRPDTIPVWNTGTFLPSGPSARGDDMQPGDALNPNQSLTSANGEFTFAYQGDGNLVLYKTSGWTPLWASRTAGKPVGICIMQTDGNLVIYAPGRQAVWSSRTGHARSHTLVQNDGNTVIYQPDGSAVWATGTVQP